MMTYTLIGCTKWFVDFKVHVSKDHGSASESLCGRRLGFDWCLVSITGKQNDEERLVTKEEALRIKSLCKICKSML